MSTEIKFRAEAFTGEGRRNKKAIVSGDGSVRVWDSVAGHYTSCHALTEKVVNRIRKQAAKK